MPGKAFSDGMKHMNIGKPQALRDTLLPRLLSGELSVAEVEKEVSV